MQVKAAEELGAVGLIMYSDPRDQQGPRATQLQFNVVLFST
jgi:hypothetical protein